MRPTNLLFDPTKFGLELGGADDERLRVLDHQVDDATNGPIHRHFQMPCPPLIERFEHRLHHASLEGIADPRASARIDPEAQVAAK